jgi:hypothetical protein
MAEAEIVQRRRWDLAVDWEDADGNGWRVFMDTCVIDGVPRLGALMIEPQRPGQSPLTARTLREVPVGALFASQTVVSSEIEARARVADSVRRVGSAQQGKALTYEDLEAVALAYRVAQLARRPVQEAVATACGISKAAAVKRIMAARRAGFLPPAPTRPRKGADRE